MGRHVPAPPPYRECRRRGPHPSGDPTMIRLVRCSLIALAAVALDVSISGTPAAFAARALPTAKATFAGGCFWCMETAFEGIPGVRSVISGYSGGPEKHPTYHDVSAGKTGHL